MLLRGGTGLGRTALLQAAARAAEQTGRQVVWITGAPFESELPYSGLHQLIFALRQHLGRLPEQQGQILDRILGQPCPTDEDRLSVSAGTLALLTETAARAPMVLILDDVQWIDTRSAEALAFVARRWRDLPGLAIVAATSRGGTVLARADLRDHEITPLNEGHARQLLTATHPDLGNVVRQRILDEARGNPLVLLELPETLTEEQRKALLPLPRHLAVSHRLTERFGDEITGLPDATRRLLLLTALEDVSLSQLSQAAADPNAVATLGPAEQAGLVEIQAYWPVLTHPVLRHLVVQLATRGELLEAHTALADVLHHDPDARARHLAEAAIGPDDRTAEALVEAGDRAAARGQFTAAATALHRAAKLSTRAADRLEYRANAAHMAWQGGWHEWAMRLNAESGARPAAGTYLAAMHQYFRLFEAGDVAAAQEQLVLAMDNPASTPKMRRVLLEMMFHNCAIAASPERWQVFADNLHRWDPQRTALVHRCWEILTNRSAGHAEVRETLVGMLTAAMSSGTQLDVLSVFSLSSVSVAFDLSGDIARTLRGFTAGEAGGNGSVLVMLATKLDALDCFHSGRWDEAAALARKGTALAEDLGFETFVYVFRAVMAMIAAAQGDAETAMDRAEDILRFAVPRGLGLASNLAWQASCLTALSSGDFEQAYAYATRVAPPGELAAAPMNAPRLVLDLVESGLRIGRGDQALNHVTAAVREGFEHLSPRIAVLVRGAAALVAPDERTDTLFCETLATPGEDQWPFEYARVRLNYGEWLRRQKDIGPARQQLSTALEMFDRLGARGWALRTRTELRAAGVAVSRSADFAPRLTAQEESIAKLAARGLTNKQIGARLNLSARTISGHLYKIFPKLGVASRTGLRDALEQLTGLDNNGTAN